MKYFLGIILACIVIAVPAYSMKSVEEVMRAQAERTVRFYTSHDQKLIAERCRVSEYLVETKQILAKDNNTYTPEPVSKTAPLDRDHVMNDYWRSIEVSQDPTIKDAALKNILSLNFTDVGYPLLRYHVAAAIYAGANADVKGTSSALHRALVNKDFALCRLLLSNGANPCQKHLEMPLLFDVETKELAVLFLQKGAKLDALYGSQSLLHRVMAEAYEPDLVELYRERGLSPFLSDSNGNTPLANLALLVDTYKNKNEIEDKVLALFSDLDQEGIRNLVTERIFEILRGKTSSCARFLETLLHSSFMSRLM